MSDYMLLEYLRNKGVRGNDDELAHEFKKYMQARYAKRGRKSMRNRMPYEMDDFEVNYNRHDWDDYDDYPKSRHAMYNTMSEEHFDAHEAKQIVSEMYHYDADHRHTGEHFDMHKAEEVYAKHKGSFVSKATPEDVYVAINATYHDMCGLYKTWFGSNIDERIIMAAITFWFKDDDYQGNKILEYFE